MTTFPGDHDLDWHRALPELRRPVIIAAFEGWNDAGDAATSAARHLAERFDATPLASIDPERYFDFGTTRPLVHLDDDRRRTITWPNTDGHERNLQCISAVGAGYTILGSCIFAEALFELSYFRA